jgi:hypothetical protein
LEVARKEPLFDVAGRIPGKNVDVGWIARQEVIQRGGVSKSLATLKIDEASAAAESGRRPWQEKMRRFRTSTRSTRSSPPILKACFPTR